MAPRNWKRPLTLIYDNNYKYGNSLYSGAIDEIERRYLHSMSRTHLSSERMDTGFSSFASSSIGAGSSLPSSLTAAAPYLLDRSSSMSPLLDSGGLGGALRRVRSVPDMPSFMSEPPASRYRSRALLADPFNMEEQARARRRRRRRVTDEHSLPSIPEFSTVTPFHRERPVSSSSIADISFLVDKCRHLQGELENVSHRVTEAEAKLKADLSGAKSKIEMGLSELNVELQDSGRQNAELQKVIKRQARQMAVSSMYAAAKEKQLQEEHRFPHGDAVPLRRTPSPHERSQRGVDQFSASLPRTPVGAGYYSAFSGPGSFRVRSTFARTRGVRGAL